MALESSPRLTIQQGEDKDVTIAIAERAEDGTRGDAVDLASATEIAVLFPKEDGGVIIKRLTLGQITPLRAAAGLFKARLTAGDTALLKKGDGLGIEVRYTVAGYLTIVQLPNSLSVQPSLFPNATI